MTSELYDQTLKAYLESFQERVLQPKLKRLNYIVESRKTKPALNGQLAWLGKNEKTFEKMAQNNISKDKLAQSFLHGKNRGVLPKYIESTTEDCRRFREEVLRRGNTFQGKPVIELKPFFRHLITTQNPKTLKTLPKLEKLLGGSEKQNTGWGWGWSNEGPFQAYLDAQMSWFQGDEEEVDLYSGSCFVPTCSTYRYFIKWDGKGWYAALAEPRYGYTGSVRIRIQLNTYFIQMPYPNVITVRRVPWSILNIESANAKESNFLGGFEFFETSVSFKPEELVLITQEMQLSVYSINYAFAILDFRGWEDDPYWVNFGLFGIPNEN